MSAHSELSINHNYDIAVPLITTSSCISTHINKAMIQNASVLNSSEKSIADFGATKYKVYIHGYSID
jgi:hypothetical protein